MADQKEEDVVVSVVKYADKSEGTIVWEQWSRIYGHKRHDTAEDALLMAVLEDALRELIALQGKTHHKLHLEIRLKNVKRWFSDRKHDDMFSFKFIWEHFFPSWSIDRARVLIVEHPAEIADRIEYYRSARKKG